MAWGMMHFRIGERVAIAYKHATGGSKPGHVVRVLLDETPGEVNRRLRYEIQLDDDPDGHPRVIPAFRVNPPPPSEEPASDPDA